MATFHSGPYEIEINLDPCYTEDSADNINQYELIYLDQSKYRNHSITSVKIKKNDSIIKTAVVGGHGGGTGIHDHSVIIEPARLLVCCSDTIFCLSTPNLNMLWQTKADMATCFGIYPYKDSYIVHGEMEITRLDKGGKILWQHGGADIFTTLEGRDDFSLTDEYIIAIDWNHTQYKFDYDGNIIR